MRRHLGWSLLLAGLLAPAALASSADDVVLEAQAFLDSGEIARGLEVLEAAVQEHGDDPRIHYLLGQAYRTASPALPAKAEEAFRATLRLDPNYPGAHASLAGLMVLAGRVAEAQEVLEGWVELEPDNARAVGQLGAFFQSQGRPEEGARLLERAAEMAPSDPEVWLELGKGRLRHGDPGASVEALERARDLAPDSAEIRYNLAQSYAAAGREDDSDVELEKYQELQEAREERKAEAKARGLLFRIIAMHERELRVEPDQPFSFYTELVRHYLLSETLDSARGFLTSLGSEHPDLAQPLVAMALMERQQSPDLAWEWTVRALERDPHSLPALRVQLGLADTGERRAVLRSALAELESDPEAPPEISMLRSRLAGREGKVDEAREILEAALERRPGHPGTTRALAQVYSGQGLVVKAMSLLQSLLDTHPDDGEAWFLLAQVEMRMNLIDLGKEHMQRALAEGHETPEVLNALATVLAHEGSNGEAIALLERSLAIQEEQPRFRRMLESLRQEE